MQLVGTYDYSHIPDGACALRCTVLALKKPVAHQKHHITQACVTVTIKQGPGVPLLDWYANVAVQVTRPTTEAVMGVLEIRYRLDTGQSFGSRL